MDERRFDRVVKGLATSTPRRRVVRGLVAAVAGLGGVVLGSKVTEAGPNRCAAECASARGAAGAACRQRCRQCGGINKVCTLNNQPLGTGDFVCCTGAEVCSFFCAGPGCVPACVPL